MEARFSNAIKAISQILDEDTVNSELKKEAEALNKAKRVKRYSPTDERSILEDWSELKDES